MNKKAPDNISPINSGKIVYKSLLLIPIVLFSTINVVNADLYKWINPNGAVHYSDSTPTHATHSTTLEIDSAPSVSTTEESNDSLETVDLYTTSWCPYCVKARAFLRANNIPFNDYDIEKDPNAAQRKHQLDSGYSGIPLAVIKGNIVRGYSENTYRRALD